MAACLPRLLFVSFLALAAAFAAPNYVIFFLDDNGWGDNSINVASVQETPNMKRMADNGMSFSDFHAAAPVCTPSRAGLLTGRTAARTGVFQNFSPQSLDGIAQTELTMADVLSKNGYQTHMIGKWHLGHHAGYHPTYRGFDTWLGLPYSNDMGCLDDTPQGCEPYWNRSQGQPACPQLCQPDDAPRDSQVAIPLYDTRGRNCSFKSCDATIVQQPFDVFHLNDNYTQRAVELIQNFSTSSQPFLLYVAYAHTHTPLMYNPRFDNASTRPGRAKIFGNTLAEVDHSVGTIYDELGKQGLLNDTLIFLAADNGPADLGRVACEAIGSAGPYTGDWQRSPTGGLGGASLKTTTWEGGHRVVGAAVWHGHIAPGQRSRTLASTLDYLPTMMALSNITPPADRVFDGIDLSPTLLDGQTILNRTIFIPDGHAMTAMRWGDYKVYRHTSGAKPCVGSQDTELGPAMFHYPYLAFNITTDPSEVFPLIVDNELQATFEALWTAYNTSVTDTLHSNTSYASGDYHAWPCCSTSSSCCRCPHQSP